MATNPVEEVDDPGWMIQLVQRVNDNVRSNAVLFAFVAGQVIGFILARI